MPGSGRLPDTVTRVLIAAALILAAAAAAVRLDVMREARGSDLAVICAAQKVLEGSRNPYDGAELQRAGGAVSVPLTYAPLLVRAAAPFCGRNLLLPSALALLTLVIIVWYAPIASAAIGTAAVASGFAALPWLLLTANVAALEGVAGAIALVALMANMPVMLGVAIGAMAFVKVSPLALVLAAFVRWPARTASKAAAACALVFTALHGVGYLLDPENTVRYAAGALGGFGGHLGAEMAFGSEANPSMFSFLPHVAAWAGAPREAGLAAAGLIAGAFGLAWLRLWRAASDRDADRVWLALLAMAVMTVCHPRFKPYSAFLLTPALAFALQRLSGRTQHAGLVAACVLPNLLLLILTIAESRALALPVPAFFALQYAQWICVAAALALALTPRATRAICSAGRA